MHKILILTFYYSPDLCAGSFRSAAFTSSLVEKLGRNVSIDVLTTMPNRYHSFKNEALEYEKSGNLFIRRIQLPDHKSGMFDQSRTFITYIKGVAQHINGKEYDAVFATSSRLFTAFLGAVVSRKLGCPLYLDIRDIFTDTLDDVLNNPLKMILLPILRKIERFTIKSAVKINLVSKGFEKYFMGAASDKEYSYYTNGIDEEFLDYNYNSSDHSGMKIILYAGNIGEGQGLEKIIPDAAKALAGRCEFWLIGDGGTRKKLEVLINNSELKNVKILDPVGRDDLMRYYAKADYLFLHLNDYEAFKKVLPSKIFEFAATGKPIVAGVSGYSKEFIESYIDGSVVFEPCNSLDFIEKFNSINGNTFKRGEFITKYSRKNIMDQMALDFKRCIYHEQA